MALPQAVFIQVERMSGPDMEVLRRFNRLHSPLVDVSLLESAINQVVDDRIALAKEFLDSANRQQAGTPLNVDLRNSLSRAYYAVHHAARALALFISGVDPYGHKESIERLGDLISSDPILKGKLSSHGDVVNELLQLLHERHLADYHPYGASTPQESPLAFLTAAPAATKLAAWFLAKAEEFVVYKRANP